MSTSSEVASLASNQDWTLKVEGFHSPSMKKKRVKEMIGPDQVRVEDYPKVSANFLIARVSERVFRALLHQLHPPS